MGQLNYNTLRPFAQAKNGFPRLLQPYEKINGKINGNTFHISLRCSQFWKDGGNLQVYTEDEYMYAVNQYGFRGNDFVLNQHINDSRVYHTWYWGEELQVWGEQLMKKLRNILNKLRCRWNWLRCNCIID